MNETKKERIAEIKKLLEYEINHKYKENDPVPVLMGNIKTKHNLIDFLIKAFRIFLILSKNETKIDEEETELIWKLIYKIENIQFVKIYDNEFMVEELFIRLLVSYRLFFNKIIGGYMKQSNFYKTLTEKQKEGFEEEINTLRKKIITPVGYNIHELADYYIEIVKKKRELPSFRELEKNSDYDKERWRTKIFLDVEFILTLLGKIQKQKNKLPKKLYNKLYGYWAEKFQDIQNTDIKYQNKSKAKNHDGNIGIKKD